ncbi:MAG: hypothetical protein R3E97_15220 [Candidatus Eisenbacteria bacterium]
MRMPHPNLAPYTLARDFGEYLAVRLQVVPEVAAIHDGYMEKGQGVLEAEIETFERTQRALRAAMARRDYHAECLDQGIRVLAFTILGRVNNNREAPIYRQYFPDGYGEVRELPLEERRRRAFELVGQLQGESDEMILTQLEPLRRCYETFETALADYQAALDDEARGRANLDRAKQLWTTAYRNVFLELRNHFAHDPKRAETFFRRAKKSTTESKSTNVTTEASVETGPRPDSSTNHEPGTSLESGMALESGTDLESGTGLELGTDLESGMDLESGTGLESGTSPESTGFHPMSP